MSKPYPIKIEKKIGTRSSLTPQVADLPNDTILVKKYENSYLGGVFYPDEGSPEPIEVTALCCFESNEWALCIQERKKAHGGTPVAMGIQKAIDIAVEKAHLGIIALAFFHDEEPEPYKFFYTN